jgi:hypothetical protein
MCKCLFYLIKFIVEFTLSYMIYRILVKFSKGENYWKRKSQNKIFLEFQRILSFDDDLISIYHLDNHFIFFHCRMDSPRLNYVYLLVFLVSLNIISTYSAPPPRWVKNDIRDECQMNLSNAFKLIILSRKKEK